MNEHPIQHLIARHSPKPTDRAVRLAITTGKLKGKKIGVQYFVTEKDYLAWLAGFPHPRTK